MHSILEYLVNSIIIPDMKSPRIRTSYSAIHNKIISAVVSARKKACVSQSELAIALGLNQSDISKIETGERRLDVVEFLQLVDYLSEKLDDPNLIVTLITSSRDSGG